MQLKKLVIIGFKSFADKTALYFDSGITCVVGPNGCGKSNIADAFRWVLGEQSARSLRGTKMADVIFSGTTQRKALNYAEVSITLGDIQGQLPIDYEEITITRRLHRNGESEYLLNGNQTRLKDIQGLFLDSGVGHQVFSIFEQGKIDEVINDTPFERRGIFEQAAGISRFLHDKKEGLKRLEMADQNISRAKDLFREVEQQILVLEEQAAKALRFKADKDQMEMLEKSSYVLRWQALEKRSEEAEKRKKLLDASIEDTNTSLAQVQIKAQESKMSLAKAEETLQVYQEKTYKIRSEKEICAREHVTYLQRQREMEQKERKLRSEMESLGSSKQTRQSSLSEIRKKEKALEEEFRDAEFKLREQGDKVRNHEKEASSLRKELQDKQQHHVNLLRAESQQAAACKQAETRLENQNERKVSLLGRSNSLKEEALHLAQSTAHKKQQLSQMSAVIEEHRHSMEAIEKEILEAQNEIKSHQKSVEELKRKRMEQQARRKVLLKLREDQEGFSADTKKLLKQSQDNTSALFGKIRPLYEYLQPDGHAAEALSTLLRHYTHTLIVETTEDFNTVLAIAKKEGILDFSLLCMEMIKPSSLELSPLFSNHIVKNPLSMHLLGGISEAYSHEEACSLLEKGNPSSILVGHGAFFDANGVFFSVKPNENHLFMRESELRTLEEELPKSEEIFQSLIADLESLENRKSKLSINRSELDKILRRDEMKLVEMNVGLQRALADIEKLDGEQARAAKEIAELEAQIDQQSVLVKQLMNQHSASRQELLHAHEGISHLEKEVEKKIGTLRIQQQSFKEREDHFRKIKEERGHLVHQLNLHEVKQQEQDKQEIRLIEELSYLEEGVAKLQGEIPRLSQTLELYESQLVELMTACREQEKQIQNAKTTLERLSNENHSLLDQLRKKESESKQLEIQVAQDHSSSRALEAELLDRYQLAMSDAKGLVVTKLSIDQTEKQMRALRQSIQSMDNINLASIEDLEKQKQRYSLLKQQLDDMEESKKELLHIINQIDAESRKRFRTTFESIQANFRNNFQVLFNGGEADLQLTEAGDILEAGIEIIAKPPGKQMRSISLLSGGEKCLTAMALLFSIFEVKPAPFCILDEIDAPLDDTNVGRFTNMVRHFGDRCQFLIITHNKRTMSIADKLFGVSMEEKGVSKLLSLEFAKKESLVHSE